MTFLIHGDDLLHLPGFHATHSGGLYFHIYDADGEHVTASPLRYERCYAARPEWINPGDKIKTIDHQLMVIDWIVREVKEEEGQWMMFGKALRWGRAANLEWANDQVLAAIKKTDGEAKKAA
ncbi:MAG TPA: hypothetical protein PLN21_06640 [Gemmatales bacterium]|nr:hypothetical protein [Gemmatales bacterium]